MHPKRPERTSSLNVLAVVLFAGLVAAWGIVTTKTFHGAIVRGTLLTSPAAPPAPVPAPAS